MSFPSTPVDGQTKQVGGITYQYSLANNAWTRLANGITVTTANIATLSLGGGAGQLSTTEVYDLDDISPYTDGTTNTFALRYNGIAVTFASPWTLQVTVNGAQQPAFVYMSELVWHGDVLAANRGYTVDYAGNLKFADPPPLGSQVTVRTQMGTNSQTSKKYPFSPLDILTGA